MGAGREDDMSEKFTPDTLRALVAHGKGTPAEYIVKRADIDAHADAWQAREEALRRLAQAQADVEALRVELLLILDHVDYTNGACAVNEMVGAVLPHQIIARARERLTALPEHLRGASR